MYWKIRNSFRHCNGKPMVPSARYTLPLLRLYVRINGESMPNLRTYRQQESARICIASAVGVSPKFCILQWYLCVRTRLVTS